MNFIPAIEILRYITPKKIRNSRRHKLAYTADDFNGFIVRLASRNLITIRKVTIWILRQSEWPD